MNCKFKKVSLTMATPQDTSPSPRPFPLLLLAAMRPASGKPMSTSKQPLSAFSMRTSPRQAWLRFPRRTTRALILSIANIAVLQFSILAFGAVTPITTSLVALLATVLLILAATLPLAPASRTVFAAICWMMVALLAYAGLQAVLHLPATLLPDMASRLGKTDTARDPGTPILPPLWSLQPADTMQALLSATLPATVFLTGLLTLRKERVLNVTFFVLAHATGLFIALSLMQFELQPHFILFYEKTFYLDSFTFTFINRNSAGTVIGLTLLSLLFLLRPTLDRIRRGRMRLQDVSPATLFTFVLTLFVLAALLSTKSRGAIACTLVATALLAVFSDAPARKASDHLNSPRWRHRMASLLGAAGLGIGLLLLLAVLAGRVLLRAQAQGAEDLRFCILPAIERTIERYWLLGSGLGTFRQAFAPFRDPLCGISGIWEKAHNSFLEAWICLGIAGPAAIAATLVIITCALWPRTGWVRRRRHGVFGLSVMTLMTLHSLVDFPLQIPAVSMYGALILAIAIAGTGITSTRTRNASILQTRR